MKLGKKLLAIVLAAAMLIGVIAVAANADGYDLVTAFSGSKLAYFLNAPDLSAGGSGKLSVDPGQEITVKVTFRNNFYTLYSAKEAFFYSTSFFDKVTSMDSVTIPATSPASKTNITPNFNVPARVYPAGYSNTLYSAFMLTRGLNTAYDTTKSYFPDETVLYTIKFKVKDDAQLGDTGEIIMPQGAAYSANNAGQKGLVYMEVYASSDALSSVSIYSETCDLSKAKLEFEVCDNTVYVSYDNLDTVYNASKTLDPASADYYNADDYAAWQQALAAAADLLAVRDAAPNGKVTDDEQGTIQAAVDAAATALSAAYAKLSPAYVDVAALTTAVDKYDTPKGQLDKAYYDATEYAAWEDALAAAQTALTAYTGAPDTDANRAAVAEAATNLKNAWDNLHPDYVDCTDLVDAVADCGTTPYAESFYDADQYADWATALSNAKATIISKAQAANSAENRQIVSDAATALRNAFNALVPHIVNTAPLVEAIADCNTPDPESADFYDAALYAAWEQALADARQTLSDMTGVADTAENRQTVADAAQALRDAFAALVPAYVDTTALEEAIDANDEIDPADPDYYDADKYANWQSTLANAITMVGDYKGKKADTETNRNAVATMAQAVADARAALVPAYVDLTALNAAIDACDEPDYDEEYYDELAYSGWELALAHANNVASNLDGAPDTEDNRTAVANAKTALENAYAALEPQFVDLTALADAVSQCGSTEYPAEYYDADDYAAWENALAAAQDGLSALDGEADTESNRNEANTLKTDLEEAFAALEPSFVDYSELETALEECVADQPKEAYEPETWAPYEAALAAANDLNDNRPDPLPPAGYVELEQQISDAVNELRTTFEGLELAKCHVTAVECLAEFYQVGDRVDYKFTLDKQNATKVQVLCDNGGTRTYDVANSAVKSITKNEDGTEEWIITIPVTADEYTLKARSKFGKVWDTAYFTYEGETKADETEKYKVYTAEVKYDFLESTKYQVITVTTDADVMRIRLVNAETGSTLTYSKNFVEADGIKTWTITRKFPIGEHTWNVYATKDTNVLQPTELSVSFVVEEYVDPTTRPISGEIADAIKSAEVDKARALRDKPLTFTVMTDANCKGIKLVDKDLGIDLFAVKTGAVDNGDGTETWTVTKAFSVEGEYNGTFSVLYGSTWTETAETIAFEIAY